MAIQLETRLKMTKRHCAECGKTLDLEDHKYCSDKCRVKVREKVEAENRRDPTQVNDHEAQAQRYRARPEPNSRSRNPYL